MLHNYPTWWTERICSLVPEPFAAGTGYANALVLQSTAADLFPIGVRLVA